MTGDGIAREAQGPADRAVVVVERRGLAPAGEEELVAPVVVAVERGDAPAHEVLELAVVAVVDAGGRGVVDEARRRRHPTTPLLPHATSDDRHAEHADEQPLGRPAVDEAPARRWRARCARPD